MITIGKFLHAERVSRKISLEAVERKTKIKSEFVEALEDENWSKLPEFPVVLGFVKNIAKTYDIDVNKAVALLRRDYPPKIVSVDPKPPALKRFVWGPKTTLIAVIFFVSLLVFGYLGYQAYRFLSPPSLLLISPKEGEVLRSGDVLVSGKTDIGASVIINNQPVLVNSDGYFETSIPVDQNTKNLKIQARSRAGKIREIDRSLKIEE